MNYDAIVFILNRGMHRGGGFFSLFFFLCNAYLRAKEEGVPFYIVHDEWTYTHTLGWHDYFTTLREWDHRGRALSTYHMALSEQRSYPLSMYVECIRDIFQLRPELVARANKIRDTLGSYTAVFVRRGDKCIEIPDCPVETIVPRVQDATTLFVQSDDYTVVEEFRSLLPNHRIVATVPPTKRGSYHNAQYRDRSTIRPNRDISWDLKTREAIQAETEEMLIGMYLCAHAEKCWTDDTSNVGRFLKLWAPSTTHVYTTDAEIDLAHVAHPAWGL
jgi:hypothetical protein